MTVGIIARHLAGTGRAARMPAAFTGCAWLPHRGRFGPTPAPEAGRRSRLRPILTSGPGPVAHERSGHSSATSDAAGAGRCGVLRRDDDRAQWRAVRRRADHHHRRPGLRAKSAVRAGRDLPDAGWLRVLREAHRTLPQQARGCRQHVGREIVPAAWHAWSGQPPIISSEAVLAVGSHAHQRSGAATAIRDRSAPMGAPAVASGACSARMSVIVDRHRPQRIRCPCRRYMQPTVRQRPLAAVSRQVASFRRLQTQTIIGTGPDSDGPACNIVGPARQRASTPAGNGRITD